MAMGDQSKNLENNAFKALKPGVFLLKIYDFWTKNRLGSGLGAQLGLKRRPDRVQRDLGNPKIAPRTRRGAPRRRQDGPRSPQDPHSTPPTSILKHFEPPSTAPKLVLGAFCKRFCTIY